MEKLGIDQSALRDSLLKEEANLMIRLQKIMTRHEKTAQDLSEQNSLESQLMDVRSKIQSIDK